ncbi:uncharacterized protein KY384_008964 [Bacidia gigantensis]|uniref:uncharacterized protein n=1 Tax=Bacidia gigantensis TaxID=2732470 RepID=UPI001D03D969|nr:uncharacterized protein KY384_008964 [Bacidia gigantensis]KAG8525320.1 hypothetical protein KY384_008964 [Bacidia gigantensis]
MRDSGFHPFGGRLNPDDPYLSYHDVRLTREDIRTLKDDWLTDNSISFWEEYLEREHLAKEHTAHIVLLRPSMSFLLMQTANPDTLKTALPDFKRTTHIFLPINDCQNPNLAEGGSHWSLLLVSVLDGIAFHYDSLCPANHAEAEVATYKLSQLMRRPLKCLDLPDSPRQENSSDCGVFVCIQMRHLLLKKLLMVESEQQEGRGEEKVVSIPVQRFEAAEADSLM